MFFCPSHLPVKKQQQRRRKNKGEEKIVYLDLVKQTEIAQGSSPNQNQFFISKVSMFLAAVFVAVSISCSFLMSSSQKI